MTYKYIDNGNFIEIYDEDGNLIYIDKSYILEPEVKASTMKVKIIERESDGKNSYCWKVLSKWWIVFNNYVWIKNKDEDIEKWYKNFIHQEN